MKRHGARIRQAIPGVNCAGAAPIQSAWDLISRYLLQGPADELVACGEVVVGGGELAAVGVLVVEPRINHGVDGSFAVFGGGHEDVVPFTEYRVGCAADGDGADILDIDDVRVVDYWAGAVDGDFALFPISSDDMLAKDAVEVDAEFL